MSTTNYSIDLDGVMIKISKMKLWVVTQNNPTPRHRFRLSVYDFRGRRKFYENVVICGYCENFEFKESAEMFIGLVLKRMNKKAPDLILQSIDNRDNFKKFLAAFENTLTTMLDNELPPLYQLF